MDKTIKKTKWLVVTRHYGGDVHNIYIVIADSENNAVREIKDQGGGLMAMAYELDKLQPPWTCFLV
jgi:hypothetical protein